MQSKKCQKLKTRGQSEFVTGHQEKSAPVRGHQENSITQVAEKGPFVSHTASEGSAKPGIAQQTRVAAQIRGSKTDTEQELRGTLITLRSCARPLWAAQCDPPSPSHTQSKQYGCKDCRVRIWR
jgi:hypothetical protein